MESVSFQKRVAVCKLPIKNSAWKGLIFNSGNCVHMCTENVRDQLSRWAEQDLMHPHLNLLFALLGRRGGSRWPPDACSSIHLFIYPSLPPWSCSPPLLFCSMANFLRRVGRTYSVYHWWVVERRANWIVVKSTVLCDT